MKSAPLLLTMVGLALVLSVSSPAFADELTYSASLNASGTLNGVAFTDRQISIVGTANSSDRHYLDSSDRFDVISAPLVANITGLGSFSFLSPGDFFVSPSSSGGVAGVLAVDTIVGLGDFLDIRDSAFISNDPLITGLPYQVDGGTPAVPKIVGFATSGGVLFLTGTTGTANFDAIAATPEPGTLLLLGTGLLGIAGKMRHRFS